MDRKQLASILRGWADLWHRRTGRPLYALAARLQERGCHIDPTQLSKLLNGREGVRVRADVIRAMAAEVGANPDPALRAAGFVVDGEESKIPPRLQAVLSSFSDWELELLADHIPRWRADRIC